MVIRAAWCAPTWRDASIVVLLLLVMSAKTATTGSIVPAWELVKLVAMVA